jgi:hypothetical protein
MQNTDQEGYGDLMDMSGETLPEFLQNLDELHARVGVIFPKLQPPSFDCEQDRQRPVGKRMTSEI